MIGRRPRDTVARWIALTILIAMLTALAFNALFAQLAGVWARPPLSESGLLDKLAVIIRMVEAADPAQRASLAQSAGDGSFSVSWSVNRAELRAAGYQGQHVALRRRGIRAFADVAATTGRGL